MNFKEPVAAALHSNLDGDDLKERPVDRLASFAKADRLGTLLWRLKYANDATCYTPALFLLVKEMEAERKDNFHFRQNCAKIALDEWLADKCISCLGSGEVMQESLPVPCPVCGGHAIVHYTDRDRARKLGITPDQAAKMSKRISNAQEIITNMDRKVNRTVAFNLEKI